MLQAGLGTRGGKTKAAGGQGQAARAQAVCGSGLLRIGSQAGADLSVLQLVLGPHGAEEAAAGG